MRYKNKEWYVFEQRCIDGPESPEFFERIALDVYGFARQLTGVLLSILERHGDQLLAGNCSPHLYERCDV
jgi:hypothetical protein